MELSEKEIDLLKRICNDTSKGILTILDYNSHVGELIKDGWVETNPLSVFLGPVELSATDKGMKFCGYVKTNERKNMKFELDEGIEIPNKKSGGFKTSKYPFDDMEVGQSFHLAVSEKYSNPSRTLASSASSQNKKCNGEKRFEVRPVDETDPKGPGARCWRTK